MSPALNVHDLVADIIRHSRLLIEMPLVKRRRKGPVGAMVYLHGQGTRYRLTSNTRRDKVRIVEKYGEDCANIEIGAILFPRKGGQAFYYAAPDHIDVLIGPESKSVIARLSAMSNAKRSSALPTRHPTVAAQYSPSQNGGIAP